jgi:type II secretory pathway pseudopilin PulG
MRLNYINNSRKNIPGFSILEVVVALGIVTMGLLGVSSLVIQNIQVQSINKNYLVASMLSQEGLELVRNVRDENWLIPGNSWNTDITDGDGDFIIDYRGRDYIDNLVDDIDNPNARLGHDGNNFYLHGGGAQTQFYRLISVIDNGDFIAASSTVRWQGKGQVHDYVAETIFYNWR